MDYDEFKCPICKNKYDEDVYLPRLLLSCGHTICSECIRKSIMQENHMLICPEDSMEYNNIKHEETLPKNMTLLKLINKANESVRSPKTTTKPTNTHSILQSIKKMKKNCTSYCAQHQNRALELICIDDNCRICTNCALFGEHRNHNVMNIDDLQKDIEIKAELLIDLFDLIGQQLNIKKVFAFDTDEVDGIVNMIQPIESEPLKEVNAVVITAQLGELAQCITKKSTEMSMIIKDYTNELITKVKEEEKAILDDLSNKFSFLFNKVEFIKKFPKELNNTTIEWNKAVQAKLDVLNDINDFEEQCLTLIEKDKELKSSYNYLIDKGESILTEYEKLSAFPSKRLALEIENISLDVDRSILLKPILSLKSELNVIDIEKRFTFEGENESKNQPSLNPCQTLQTMSNINCVDDEYNSNNNTSFLNLSDDSIIHISKGKDNYYNLTDINLNSTSTSLINPKKKNTLLRENKSNPKLIRNKSKERNFSLNQKTKTPRKSSSSRSKSPHNEQLLFIKSQFKGETANFSRIDIGNEGAKIIADMLSKKHKLKEIKLTRCKIHDEGAIELFNIIKESSTCTSIFNINIANNFLSDKSTDAIIALLSKPNSSLKTLYLTNNSFTLQSKDRIKNANGSNMNKKNIITKVFI